MMVLIRILSLSVLSRLISNSSESQSKGLKVCNDSRNNPGFFSCSLENGMTPLGHSKDCTMDFYKCSGRSEKSACDLSPNQDPTVFLDAESLFDHLSAPQKPRRLHLIVTQPHFLYAISASTDRFITQSAVTYH